MFILRSLFWLALAYAVIRPDVNLTQPADEIGARAYEAGQAYIVSQLTAADCAPLDCIGRQALAAAMPHAEPAPDALAVLPTVETASSAQPQAVPFPRPRPDWAG